MEMLSGTVKGSSQGGIPSADFLSREALHHYHGAATKGTSPVRRIACAGGGADGGLRCGVQALSTQGQEFGAMAIGQEAEVADAYESVRQDMQQETS